MTQAVKTSNANESEHRRELANAINQILLGRINSVGTITMANGTTSTVVTDPNAHSASVPVIVALSSGVPSFYVSARTKGSFTLSHTNPGAAKSLAYVLVG